MATSTINSEQQVTFEDGGTFEITDGSNTYILGRIIPGGGNMTIEPGGREIRTDTDQGVQQTPLLGNDRRTRLTIRARFTSDVAADSIDKLLQMEGTAGAVKLFSIAVKWLTNRGAITGKSYSLTNCFALLDTVKVTAGADFDTIEATFESLNKFPTVASF